MEQSSKIGRGTSTSKERGPAAKKRKPDEKGRIWSCSKIGMTHYLFFSPSIFPVWSFFFSVLGYGVLFLFLDPSRLELIDD